MRGTPPHPRGNQKLLSQSQQLGVQVSLRSGVLFDNLGAGSSPVAGIGNFHNVAALGLQLLQDLVLSTLRQLAVVLVFSCCFA